MPDQSYDVSHYRDSVEPLRVMQYILSREEYIGFLKGNIIKYAIRAGKKKNNPKELDEIKCLDYIGILSNELGKDIDDDIRFEMLELQEKLKEGATNNGS